MPWIAWALIIIIGLSTLSTILTINQPRERITPGQAVFVIIVNGLAIWGVALLGLGLA